MANGNNIFRRHARVLAALGALTLTGVGCASTSHEAKIDQSRVAGLPPGELQDVNQAQQALQDAQQQQQQAKRQSQDADQRVTLAKKDVDVADAQYDQAKAQVDVQRKNGQAVQMDQSGQPVALTEPSLNKEAAKAKLKYVEGLKDIADKQVDLAQKDVSLQEARVEQARFEALQRNRPQEASAMKVKPGDFQAKVAQKNADVAKVKADLQRLRDQANQNYEAWMQLERQTSNPERRANVPPPPRGMPLP